MRENDVFPPASLHNKDAFSPTAMGQPDSFPPASPPASQKIARIELPNTYGPENHEFMVIPNQKSSGMKSTPAFNSLPTAGSRKMSRNEMSLAHELLQTREPLPLDEELRWIAPEDEGKIKTFQQKMVEEGYYDELDDFEEENLEDEVIPISQPPAATLPSASGDSSAAAAEKLVNMKRTQARSYLCPSGFCMPGCSVM